MKTILILSIEWNVPARHGDVSSANPKLSTEKNYDIYLQVPQGMEISSDTLEKLGVTNTKELMLKLKRNFYGLKQAGRIWYDLLCDTLIKMDFSQCLTDTCIFVRIDGRGTIVVGVYVNTYW